MIDKEEHISTKKAKIIVDNLLNNRDALFNPLTKEEAHLLGKCMAIISCSKIKLDLSGVCYDR